MPKLAGAFISLEYEEITNFSWTDPKTNEVRPIRNIVGLMSHGDRTVTRVQIAFPRDPAYQAPRNLERGQHYLFPVLLSLNKKRQTVSYEIRTDVPPLPAPDVA